MYRKALFFVLLAVICTVTLSCGSSSTTTDPIVTSPNPVSDSSFSSSLFAQNTPIAYASGQYKNIQDFALGDNIYCGNSTSNWVVKKVTFAAGEPAGQYVTMLYLYLNSAGSSSVKEIIVSRDTNILMSDGTLKSCDRLIPGDQVQGVDGTLYTVNMIAMGSYSGGVYGVGANGQDGYYFIDVNGVVFAHYGLLGPTN